MHVRALFNILSLLLRTRKCCLLLPYVRSFVHFLLIFVRLLDYSLNDPFDRLFAYFLGPIFVFFAQSRLLLCACFCINYFECCPHIFLKAFIPPSSLSWLFSWPSFCSSLCMPLSPIAPRTTSSVLSFVCLVFLFTACFCV